MLEDVLLFQRLQTNEQFCGRRYTQSNLVGVKNLSFVTSTKFRIDYNTFFIQTLDVDVSQRILRNKLHECRRLYRTVDANNSSRHKTDFLCLKIQKDNIDASSILSSVAYTRTNLLCLNQSKPILTMYIYLNSCNRSS